MADSTPWGLWILVVLVGYLAYLILHSFWQYLFFAGLLAVLCSSWFQKLRLKRDKNIAALIVVLSVLLLLVIPALYVVASTVNQAPAAYQGAAAMLDKPAVRQFLGFTNDEVRSVAVVLGERLKQNVLENAAGYISTASDVLIGLFLLFITLFFLLRDGEKIYSLIIDNMPISRKQSESFFTEMLLLVRGIVFGQLATAAIQGALAGILFWILGIPNPLFWGVITTMLSIIPVLGPFLVYIPAAGFLFLQDRYIAVIVMLAFVVFVLSLVDNVVRPYIATRSTTVHPIVVILGVIGGLKLWGLGGFIFGPLVLASFLTLYKFVSHTFEKTGRSS